MLNQGYNNIDDHHQGLYSQLGFYLNSNNNNVNTSFSPILNLHQQFDLKHTNIDSNNENNNHNNNPSSYFGLNNNNNNNNSLFSSTPLKLREDVIIPPLFSLERHSTPNHTWACGDEKDTNGSKRSDDNGEEDVNYQALASTKTMKKMKARRKVREPRFCFKTMSEVDVLDDGYKWRKYGQKVVKNTLHPRSYYRCTQEKCRVKKRVERLAEDPRMVITSYEGRHVHSPSHDDDSQATQPLLNNFF